jgi:UDP-N-acetylmuramate dehydrogenase
MIAARHQRTPPWRYEELAADLGVELRRDEPLAGFTTMRVGGPAPFVFLPRTPETAARLHAELLGGPLPVRILGAGSNLIVVDEGVRAAVIVTRAMQAEPELVDATLVRVRAGQPVPGLVRWTAERGLAGLEFAEGIPAQVGGALRMNAGANQRWFSDVAERVEVAGRDGGIETREPARGDFGYRTSFIARERLFAVGAELRLVPEKEDAIRARIRAYRDRRRATQPLRERSAGCVFANYEERKVGALVEELGLKGTSVGGAAVSELHGNFIVNRGEARAADVLALVERVAAALHDATGEQPRIEVEIWRDAP